MDGLGSGIWDLGFRIAKMARGCLFCEQVCGSAVCVCVCSDVISDVFAKKEWNPKFTFRDH